MHNIHNTLAEKMNWYRKWHDDIHHHHYHFLILIIIGVILTFFLLGSIDAYARDVENIDSSSVQVTTDSIEGLNSGLVKALKRLEENGNTDTAAFVNLKNVAQKRQAKLLEKMRADGSSLEHVFMPQDIVERLPEDVQSLFETDTTLSGTITLMVDDGVDGKGTKTTRLLNTEKGQYELHIGKNAPALKSGDKVKVTGKAVDTVLWAADGANTQNLTVTSTAVANDGTGTKAVLVIPVTFANNTSQPWPTSYIQEWIFTGAQGLASLYTEGSYGKTTITGVVAPWVAIAANVGSTCDTGVWAQQADQAAQALGYNLASYQHRMYVLNGVPLSVCNFGGRAYIPGTQSWINGIYASYGTPAHELGHNLGAMHAGFYNCGSEQISSTCSFDEYGDRTSKMGSTNNYQFHALHRNQFNWLPSSSVSQVTTNGDYVIYGDYESASAPNILKISKPNTNESYYLSYRQAKGFDASMPAGETSGATIQIWSNTPGSAYTKLLTATPGAANTDSALKDGGVFSDSTNGITVTQLSHDAQSVKVRVAFSGPTCSQANPTVTVTPASQTGGAGTALAYKVSVSDADSSVCSSATYAVTAEVPSGFQSTAQSVTLTPGATGSATLSVTSPGASVDGSFPIVFKATNASSGAYTGKVNATYTVYTPVADKISPTASITSPASGATVNGNVTITASATDNVSVASVKFFIDGKLVSTDTSSPYSYRWAINKKITSGAHTIMVQSTDSSGNISTPSTITVYK